jgi:hypothetical protein
MILKSSCGVQNNNDNGKDRRRFSPFDNHDSILDRQIKIYFYWENTVFYES